MSRIQAIHRWDVLSQPFHRIPRWDKVAHLMSDIR